MSDLRVQNGVPGSGVSTPMVFRAPVLLSQAAADSVRFTLFKLGRTLGYGKYLMERGAESVGLIGEKFPVSVAEIAKWPAHLDPSHEGRLRFVVRKVCDAVSLILFPLAFVHYLASKIRTCVYILAAPGSILMAERKERVDLIMKGAEKLRAYGGKAYLLPTPDREALSAGFIPGWKQNKVILYAGGNAEQWEETMESRVDELRGFGTSILFLNCRSKSNWPKSLSEREYSLDYYTAYEFLINHMGIDPENILLVGFSMGAAFGSLGAAHVQAKYPDKKIKAVSINSFRDLRSEVVALSGKFFCGLKPIAWLALKILGVQLDAKSSWEKLKGRKCVYFNPKDSIIPKQVSLALSRPKNSEVFELESIPDHNRPWIFHERLHFENLVREMLDLWPSWLAKCLPKKELRHWQVK